MALSAQTGYIVPLKFEFLKLILLICYVLFEKATCREYAKQNHYNK